MNSNAVQGPPAQTQDTLGERGCMPRGTQRRARSPDGPGAAGLWEVQSWGPAGKERVFSEGCWERVDREVQAGLGGQGVSFCCLISVHWVQIQIYLLNAAPFPPMLHQVKNLQSAGISDRANDELD